MANITSAQQTEIFKIVIGLFNAAPGSNYLAALTDYILAGNTANQLARYLAGNDIFSSYIMAGRYTTAAKVTQLMANFGLTYSATPTTGTADGDAQNWFTQQINANRDIGDIVFDAVSYLGSTDAINSATYGSVALMLSNKAAVANYHSVTLGTSSGSLADLQYVVAGVSAMTPVATISDLASAMTLGPVSGSTASLTTGTDIISGTSGNDTINAIITSGKVTLSASDVLNGGSGQDTLAITNEGSKAGSIPAASISNIETLQITDTATLPSQYNISSVKGVTNVINKTSTNIVTLAGIPAGASLTIQGNGTTANGSTTFTMATAADAVNLILDGGLTGTNPGNVVRATTGAASITVTSSGQDNKINKLDLDTATALTGLTIVATTSLTASLGLDYASKSTLTISGSAAKVDLSGATLSGNISMIEASGMTAGGAWVKLGDKSTQFIGGAGNDMVGVDTLVYSAKTATLAAGDGFDSLRLTDQAALASTTAANFIGFEELVVGDDNDNQTDTFDLSLLSGATALKLNANSVMDGYVINNISAAQAAAVTIAGSQATAPTLSVYEATTAGQADALSIGINDGASTTGTISIVNLIAAGVESLSIAATDNCTVASLTGMPALTQLTVSGTGTSNLTLGALAVNPTTVVDASSVTGSFTFNGTAATGNGLTVTGSTSKGSTITATPQADTLVGGAGNDVIVGGASGDTINVGTGTDAIQLLAATDSFVGAGITSGTTVLTGIDVVSGMGAGDTISLAKISTAYKLPVGTAIESAAGAAASIVLGNYDSVTGIFTTASSTGTDALFVYDADATGGGTNLGAIVLPGYTGAISKCEAGIFTLA